MISTFEMRESRNHRMFGVQGVIGLVDIKTSGGHKILLITDAVSCEYLAAESFSIATSDYHCWVKSKFLKELKTRPQIRFKCRVKNCACDKKIPVPAVFLMDCGFFEHKKDQHTEEDCWVGEYGYIPIRGKIEENGPKFACRMLVERNISRMLSMYGMLRWKGGVEVVAKKILDNCLDIIVRLETFNNRNPVSPALAEILENFGSDPGSGFFHDESAAAARFKHAFDNSEAYIICAPSTVSAKYRGNWRAEYFFNSRHNKNVVRIMEESVMAAQFFKV